MALAVLSAAASGVGRLAGNPLDWESYPAYPAKAGCLRRIKVPELSAPPKTPYGAPRVIICDYNALLHSVTGLLRMSGLAVFQAYDGEAARQLCQYMPEIDLLILNTEGTGTDTAALVRDVRDIHPGLPVLHIGRVPLADMPADVPHLPESFTPGRLLTAVDELIQGPIQTERSS